MKSLLVLVLLLFNPLFASEFLDVDDAFKISTERTDNSLMFSFEIAPDYYLYRDRYSIKGIEGAKLGAAEFSDNVKIKFDPNFGEDMAVFYNIMTATHAIIAENGSIQVTFQGCADAGLCYPPQKRYFSLTGEPIAAPSSNIGTSLDLGDSLIADLPQASDSNLTIVTAVIFAMIGGLILNLMPCVFPVLSIKAMQMAQLGQHQQQARAHGLAYTVGVIVSFVAVAGVLLLIRYFGDWAGWGFQLQSPYFVSFLIALFFLMSLTMTGYVEFGQNLMGVGQGLTQKSGLSGSFFTGVLATVVATPCTAPFMGSAIGFALLQPAYVSLLIFAAMGFGMAAPILLITLLPNLGALMPKPGAWMNVFRQLMAFPLFATVLWLTWVLVEIKGTDALLTVGLGLIALSIAIWPVLTVNEIQSVRLAWFKRIVRWSFVVLALFALFDYREKEDLWVDYSESLVEESLSQGKSVFIDVTAAWCITCKANERVALSGDRFNQLVKEEGVVLVKADWTNPSPAVDKLIEGFNRDGVPLYAYYHKGASEALVLPQILSFGLVAETFRGETL
ncbi:protein-disulfide reductase DsbD [Reinekea marina]|uniref:Protein-disulfide reductase DsbD family protein n=1 Tax=Reinekea marina TaxID=1310421 RepID=A0ABV7WVY6_9GAMM|nr:protein-disulfide reductase DsbD [Reinekea marina]MDN3649733.1 protein-disulfide reductase DsbD [Reinekea marina]